MGLLAAAIGALYAVYATYGLAHGLKSADMTFLRTSVAGILTLPVFVYYLRFEAEALTGQWRRWLAVALLAGPLLASLFSPCSSLHRRATVPWFRSRR